MKVDSIFSWHVPVDLENRIKSNVWEVTKKQYKKRQIILM